MQAPKTKAPDQFRPAFPEKQIASLPEEIRATARNYYYAPVRVLHHADWNYKTDNAATAEALHLQMDKNGQIENIHVRQTASATFEVFNGNHRLTYFQERNQEECLVYFHGEISVHEAHRRAIETNETFFADNPVKLGEILKGLADQSSVSDLLSTTGIDQQEFDLMQTLVDPQWYQFTPKQGEDDDPKQSALVIEVPDDLYERWKQAVFQFRQDDGDASETEVFIEMLQNYVRNNSNR